MKTDYSKFKVSIITVVYNGAKTIEKTIQSVLGQSYDNIEYIIIDGLSTDGTQEIIRKYQDSIAYFVSEKDNGLYDAMNKGIQKATGEIIGIINSDDWYAENVIEKVVQFYEQSEVDLIYGKVINILENGREILIGKKPIDYIWFQNVIHHPSVFVKRDIYEKFGVFDTKYRISADYDLLLRFYSKGVRFGYMDEIIAYFRMGGISSVRARQMEDETYAISLTHISDCPNKSDVIIKIEEAWKWYSFIREIEDRKNFLSELLHKYFKRKVENIIIFGTGFWGKKCYESLNGGEIEIQYFVDNNESMWNQEIHGISVINPIELQNMAEYVLIAVKDHGDEVKVQLTNMVNANLKCVTIKELETYFYEQTIS